MRRILATVAVALAAACGGDATGPQDDAAALDALSAFAFGATHIGDPGNDVMARLHRLPPNLALTSAQTAQIRALVEAYVAANQADLNALAAIMDQARQARQAGATAEQVRAIMAAGDPIRTRLAQAEGKLRTDILGVLTAEQRAWLERGPQQHPCGTLTQAQRTEIAALHAAFEQANAGDIALVRSIHERARSAQQSGASRQEISAILREAQAPLQRLNSAHAALREAIAALLTPEQRAAGCFR